MNSTLPPRNLHFVGQNVLLQSMDDKLQRGNRVALVGLGGTGYTSYPFVSLLALFVGSDDSTGADKARSKSQLAIEYAHRRRAKAQVLWIIFVSGESEILLEQSYFKFAVDSKLASPESSYLSGCQAAKYFLESEEAKGWLMVIDGADDAKALSGTKQLHRLLPEPTNGSIIFTTRSFQFALDLVHSDEYILCLERLEFNDATELLQNKIGKSDKDSNHVSKLVEILEGLPLALSQAASFIATSCISVEHYLDLFSEGETAKIELLSDGLSYKDESIAKSAAITWQISFQRIEQVDEFAAHILCFAACLHCREIPMILLPKAKSKVATAKALGILKGHCLIQTNLLDTLGMHSLVQLAIRYWLRSRDQIGKYTTLAFDSVFEHFPLECHQKDQLISGDEYSAHAQFVLDNLLWDKANERHVNLASRFSSYLHEKGAYHSALIYAKRAADLARAVHGKQDLHTVATENHLAIAHRWLGRYQEAEEIAAAVLASRKSKLGHEHPDTLASANNLALVLHDQGKYADAERNHRQILEVRERVLGPEHNDTLKSLNNHALSLKRLGRYDEAEEALKRAFSARENSTSKPYVNKSTILNNLGLVLRLQKKTDDALLYHTQALNARLIMLGPKHPDTLRSRQNIAIVQMNREKLEEAELTMREVITEYEKILGHDHPNTIDARSNLVSVLRRQGKYSEAERTGRNVFATREKILGTAHPDTNFSKKQWRGLAAYIKRHPEATHVNSVSALEAD